MVPVLLLAAGLLPRTQSASVMRVEHTELAGSAEADEHEAEAKL